MSSGKVPQSLGTNETWKDWLSFFVENPIPSKEDYKNAGYGYYDNKTGKYVVDHHDKDAYRRDQARTYTVDDWNTGNGYRRWGRQDILGADYQNRHNTYNNQGLLADKTGREWRDHKYIAKVKTKTGKIRYIYELPDGSKRSYAKGSLQQKEAQWQGGDGVYRNNYREARQDFGKRLEKNGKDFIKSIEKKNLKGASKAIANSLNDIASNSIFITDQISEKARNTGWAAARLANDAASNTRDVMDKATKDAQSAIQKGSKQVSKVLDNALSGLSLKDLFG